ncbi:hypothetical protein CPB97_000323 [Podila verticillata]|nr:hypothetical protein CPB97_000323 [Podila verticillata]
MADPYRSNPYPGNQPYPPSQYPPNPNMGMARPGPGGPPPHHQQNFGGPGPGGPGHGFYSPHQQPRPNPNFNMPQPPPMAQQPNFHNSPRPPPAYPPYNNGPGFNQQRPGPPPHGPGPNHHGHGHGPGHGQHGPGNFGNGGPGPGPGPGPGRPPGHGPGGFPNQGYPPQQNFGPSPPPPHAMPTPMMPQGPPRQQEWPVAGRPLNNPPNFPPHANNQVYPPSSSPGPPGHQGFAPKPYTPSGPPSFNSPYSGPSAGPGSGPVRPPFSPNMGGGAPPPPAPIVSQPAHVPSFNEPPFPVRPPNSSGPPVATPVSMPQAATYRPKTSYQAPPALSPKKDQSKAPSPSPSWATSPVPSTSNSGYQGSHSHHRPPIHTEESYDADDRPTELIPLEEEQSNYPSSLAPSNSTIKGNTTNSLLQSPPSSSMPSPSPSFTTVNYLPSSPSFSEADARPTELLPHEVSTPSMPSMPKPAEPVRVPEPLPPAPSPIKTPATPLPSTGTAKFSGPAGASAFVPKSTYVPTKKDAPKPLATPQPSPQPLGYDPSVKVEISDLKPASSSNNSYSSSSFKVALSDMPSPAAKLQNEPPALDSPISLDGLMESIEAMTKTSSVPSSSPYQPVSQTGQDYFKPLPKISEGESDQKRYSLSDGPVSSSSSNPSVARLVPKRPVSNYQGSPPPSSNDAQTPISSSSASNSNFNSPNSFSQPVQPVQPFSPPQPPAPLKLQPVQTPVQFQQPPTPSQQQPPIQFQQPKISFQPPPPHMLHQNHNHSHIGGDAMRLFNQPEFAHNPISSMVALAADKPVQKAPSMARRAKTLKRAAGMTSGNNPIEGMQPMGTPPPPPPRVTPDELYPYLLRLVLLAQADEVPTPAPSLPVTNIDTHKVFVKALRNRVKDVLAGRVSNPQYQDPIVKKALGNMEPKQFKASTNAEELMIGFSIEMSRIQATMHIPSNNRDAQIAIMVNLMREAIQQDPFTGHEAILQRLDKQTKTTAIKPNNSAQADELTKVIKDLFKHPESVRHAKMNELRRTSTRQVAIEDLRKCAANLDQDNFPYPGIADYHHKEHHGEFKNRERSALLGFIRVLNASNPSQASLEIPKHRFQVNDFTFIPENPKAYYHLLLEMCVDHALATRNENDPASGLLSASTRALLIDCGVRWRLTSSWREIILMEVIKERYREGKVPVHFLSDFLNNKFYKDSDVNQWHISEVNMLGDVYGGLNHMILDNINHDIKDLENVSADYFAPMLEILDKVHQREVYQKLNIDLTPFFEDIKETVVVGAIGRYNVKDAEVQAERYENETVPLTNMALYIVSEHATHKKRFPKPLLGAVDVAAIVVENNLRNFVPLMQNMANMDARKLPMADVFPLYQTCRELVSLFETYAPSSSAHFNISEWFRPYVLKYLDTLDTSIQGWVTAAIKQDQFEEVSVGAGHSSSASDLFAFFYEPLAWVKGLNWPNDYQRATFISKLAKVFCKAVDLYAQYMESMFTSYMPSSVTAVASTETKTLAEQLASFSFRSESDAKKASQFVFTSKMCVLVNNIEAVRQRLDELYRRMDVDEVAQILHDNEPETEENLDTPHQFEIVFIQGERLLPMDSNEASDPFIIMSHDGKDVFRSKTINANLNPRWNEVYEVTLTKEISYLIRVFDADKVHKDRLCGWQYLRIDPLDYEDYMPHDIWLDLAQIGRLLLRVTMKGERDDVQFFFGRTFRSLKRKEADLSGMIVDAMVPCIQACLTEKVLFSNFRSKTLFPFFGSSVQSAKVTKVSDEDCDNALWPLLDYFEASLPILYDYLTTEGMIMVITKLWKETLVTIESLLMPPLSTAVSDRTPLTEIEMHVIFKIIEFIKLYLNGGDAGDGFPLKALEIPKYKDLLTVRPIYDSTTEELISEYNRSLTVPGRGKLGRQQSDYDRRSAPKRPAANSMTPNPETVLRNLRMRPEETVEEFLIQAIDTQSKAREARAKAKLDQLVYQRQLMRDQSEN